MADQELSTEKSGGHTPEPCHRTDDSIISNSGKRVFRFIVPGASISGFSLNDTLRFVDRMVGAANGCRGLTAEQVEAIPHIWSAPANLYGSKQLLAIPAKLAAFEAMRVALKMMMKWTGPPPCDKASFDSLWEDAWKQACAAIKLADEAAKAGVAT